MVYKLLKNIEFYYLVKGWSKKWKIINLTDVSELKFPIIFFNHHLNSINDIGKNVTIRDTPLSPQGVCVAPIILF